MESKRNLIRKVNIESVTSLLFKNEKMFASEIVKQTGISMVTVNSLLKDMVNQNLLTEIENVPRDIGRPATLYIFNYAHKLSQLFLFIESNKELSLESYTIDMRGEIIGHESVAIKDISQMSFQILIASKLKDKQNIHSIGIILPAKINEGTITASWYGLMDNWDIQALVQEVTDIPCFFQNDAHALTIGHCILNQIKLSDPIVGIYYPKDSMPGITLLVNATILQGQHSLAGEAKYLPLFLDQGSAQNIEEFHQNLNYLIAIYNTVIAPSRFIISGYKDLKAKNELYVHDNHYLALQPNKAIIDYIENIKQSMILGLHWTIYKDTPFDLAEY